MTDKQIIIDDVDIAGCEDYGYRGKAGYWCHNYDEPCKTGNDCKQEKCIFKDNIKLKQTLTEIKEYLIKECKICKEQCAITNEDCADCQAQEILQKISEVKDV